VEYHESADFEKVVNDNSRLQKAKVMPMGVFQSDASGVISGK